MACLLKAPEPSAKGVLVFTTQERDNVIGDDDELRASIESLKDRWVIGLHHNWHDHEFTRDPLFDFSMAGEGDLIGDPVPLVTLDACNFVPPEFRPGGEPFWDLLYVARPVFFKGLEHFLETVRALYDRGRRARVLYVCAMPPFDPAQEATVFYGLEDAYLERFSRDERKLFTLLTLRHDYPFPLDLPTLAHLYRSSRVFAHFGPDERRCRVAAYAWATGLPVVGTEAVGSLLPPHLRTPPAHWNVDLDEGYLRQVEAALDAPHDAAAHAPAASYFEHGATVRALREQLDGLFPSAGLAGPAAYSTEDLGIRLGRHHGISAGPNRVPMRVHELVALVAEDETEAVEAMKTQADPEVALAAARGSDERPAVGASADGGAMGKLRRLWSR